MVRLRAGKNHLERVVQHLYPLKLSCDVSKPKTKTADLDPNAQAFKPKRAIIEHLASEMHKQVNFARLEASFIQQIA